MKLTTNIERITIRQADSTRRKLLLAVEGESERTLRGYVVNRFGERVERRVAGTADYSVEFVIADHRDILDRQAMAMNLHYGELEPA